MEGRGQRADSRPERTDFRLEMADFRPERAWGGLKDGQTNNKQTKVPLCSTGLHPLQGRCPKSRATGITDHILPLGDRLGLRELIEACED